MLLLRRLAVAAASSSSFYSSSAVTAEAEALLLLAGRRASSAAATTSSSSSHSTPSTSSSTEKQTVPSSSDASCSGGAAVSAKVRGRERESFLFFKKNKKQNRKRPLKTIVSTGGREPFDTGADECRPVSEAASFPFGREAAACLRPLSFCCFLFVCLFSIPSLSTSFFSLSLFPVSSPRTRKQELIRQERLSKLEEAYPALVPHYRDLRRLLDSGGRGGGGVRGGSSSSSSSSANAGFAAAALLSRLAREATERAAEAAAAPSSMSSPSSSPPSAAAGEAIPSPSPPGGAKASAANAAAAAQQLAPLFAFALKELLGRRDGVAAEAVLAAADRAGLRRDATVRRRAALARALVEVQAAEGSVSRRLEAAARRGDAAAAAAALADFAAAAAASASPHRTRRLPLAAFDRAFLAAERSVRAVIARTKAAVPSSPSPSPSESGGSSGGVGRDLPARVAAVRARAAALVDVAAAELDAAAAADRSISSSPLRHSPASLTRYALAAEASGMSGRGAELVRWVAGISHGGEGGGGKPPGAGAAPERPWPPPPAAVASAARALSRAGRFEEAAELLLELRGGEFSESVDERCVAAAVRFAARRPPKPQPASRKKRSSSSSPSSSPSPSSSSLPLPLPRPRGPSAAAAHDLVSGMRELGVEPATATFSALVRAELDAGSLPNALWVAEEAAAAAAKARKSSSSSSSSPLSSHYSLSPTTWACLRHRAVLRFGAAGGAAVDARRAQHEGRDGSGKGEEEEEERSSSWLSLVSAAEATGQDRRGGGFGTASAAEVARRQPNIDFDYDSEDDLWGELEGEERGKAKDEEGIV